MRIWLKTFWMLTIATGKTQKGYTATAGGPMQITFMAFRQSAD